MNYEIKPPFGEKGGKVRNFEQDIGSIPSPLGRKGERRTKMNLYYTLKPRWKSRVFTPQGDRALSLGIDNPSTCGGFCTEDSLPCVHLGTGVIYLIGPLVHLIYWSIGSFGHLSYWSIWTFEPWSIGPWTKKFFSFSFSHFLCSYAFFYICFYVFLFIRIYFQNPQGKTKAIKSPKSERSERR
jgi:hypothetical protein